nr:uncharacterized protein LOC113804579 [Penaeus vannamei]
MRNTEPSLHNISKKHQLEKAPSASCSHMPEMCHELHLHFLTKNNTCAVSHRTSGIVVVNHNFRSYCTGTFRDGSRVLLLHGGLLFSSLNISSSRQRDSGRGGAGGSQRPVASVVGPFQEGEMLVLTCLAHGGSPRPSVVWFRDTYLIDFNMESEETSPVIELASLNHTTVPPAPYVTTLNTGPSQTIAEPYNTLTLGPLTRNDLKLLLTCEASNNNLTIPTSVVVMVDMNLTEYSSDEYFNLSSNRIQCVA